MSLTIRLTHKAGLHDPRKATRHGGEQDADELSRLATALWSSSSRAVERLWPEVDQLFVDQSPDEEPV